jgi:hypothetical protein
MEKLTKLEKVILACGVGVGFGRMIFGAAIDVIPLIYSGAILMGTTVLVMGACRGYIEYREANKIIKPKNNYIHEQAGKNDCPWNPRDWR